MFGFVCIFIYLNINIYINVYIYGFVWITLVFVSTYILKVEKLQYFSLAPFC